MAKSNADEVEVSIYNHIHSTFVQLKCWHIIKIG